MLSGSRFGSSMARPLATLSVASWLTDGSNERLGDLARVIARRRFARALLEEV